MANTELALSQSFIEQQQRRLEALQKELLGAEGKTLGNERAYQEDHGEEPQEVAISVQREIDQGLHDVNKRRLSDIQRALEKIKEGTYGFSDLSGDPIPKRRLEAAPESIVTVQEEEQREKVNRG